MIEAANLGNFIQLLVPYVARHSGPSIDAALGTSKRKEIKDRGRWKADRSVLRYEQRARRERAPQSDLRLHSDREPTVRRSLVTSFLPRRPRSACFVVLSNAACKVGPKICECGFFVGWYDLLHLRPADLRRLRSDARSGRVLGSVLSPSCASWTSRRLSQTCRTSSKAWGQQPLSPNIRTGNQRIRRVIAVISELQNFPFHGS